jgi:acyl dehydratase
VSTALEEEVAARTAHLVPEWTGTVLDAGPGDVVCERGYILHWVESTENANPLYWDEAIARELTDGWIAPPSMLSVWMRPLMFKPDGGEQIRPLEMHFRLKDAFELPEGIVTGNEIVFREPVRPGDVISTQQTVAEIGDVRSNRLGTGRPWTIDVTYTNQRGDVVAVESYRMFCYVRAAK